MYIGQTLLIEAELAPFVKFKILDQLSTFTFEKKIKAANGTNKSMNFFLSSWSTNSIEQE